MINREPKFSKGVIALLLLQLLVLIDTKSQSVAFMDYNGIRGRISANGSLFHDAANGVSDFEAPRNSNSFAIYFASLCVSGNNGTSNLSSGAYINSDFTTGPLTVGTATSTALSRLQYDRIWNIRRFEISAHIANYNSPSYTAPNAITTWPAHGDTTAGFSYHLAPFEDVNSNGTYEPHLGDYPKIKGDRAMFFIYNDATTQPKTGGNAMGVEIHCMVYAFATNDPLNETIFTEYKIINRSTIDYTNSRIGKLVDFDLGNYDDDFIETDVNRSMVFIKNGDNFDESVFGVNGYGNLHASVGLITLQGPTLDDDFLDNICGGTGIGYEPNGTGFDDGIIDNERFGMSNCISINDNGAVIGGGDFTSDSHLSNFMNSEWKDGRPQTFGNQGHQSSGGIVCKIPFFLNTDSTNYSTSGASSVSTWNENSANSLPGDRKVITSSGPFNFDSGEEQTVTYAYVFARATVNSSVANSVSNLKSNSDFVINYFRASNQVSQCAPSTVSIAKQVAIDNTLRLYPNPSIGRLSIQTSFESSYLVLNSIGQQIAQGQLAIGFNKITLPSNIDSGIYLFQSIDNDGKTITKKLLISQP